MTTAIQKTLEANGFTEYNTGGGCMAMSKFLPNGKQVLVSDCDGGLDFDADNWCVGLYDAEGYEQQIHWRHLSDPHMPVKGEPTIADALRACGVEVLP